MHGDSELLVHTCHAQCVVEFFAIPAHKRWLSATSQLYYSLDVLPVSVDRSVIK